MVSSAGGSAAVGDDGSFALELAVDPEALAVELTALANGSGGQLIARRTVDDLGEGNARHAGTLVLAQSQGCFPDWIPAFGPMPGVGVNGSILALAVFDDGSGTGPALLAGGLFTSSPAGDSYLARWGCPAVEVLPGCFGNPAVLASLSSTASLGGAFHASLSGDELTAGTGLLFVGFDHTDAAGCGFFAPGFGELFLGVTAPPPLLVGSSALSSGAVEFVLPVPADPGAAGVEVALQGAVVWLIGPDLVIELSNGLAVTITR